jgi:hypothetical protein
VQMASSIGMQGFAIVFALWLQTGQGYSPLRAGLTRVAFSVGSFLVAPFAVELAHRWGRRVLAFGGFLLAVGTITVDAGARHLHGHNLWPVTPGLVIAGAGLALLVIPLVNVVLAAVPDRLDLLLERIVALVAHGLPARGAVHRRGLRRAGLLSMALPSHCVSEEEALETQAVEA